LEHGLQIAREAADDLQHLGGSCLLLQRLGKVFLRLGKVFLSCDKLAPARFELLPPDRAPARVRFRLRSG
jgi:hypothetical protein